MASVSIRKSRSGHHHCVEGKPRSKRGKIRVPGALVNVHPPERQVVKLIDPDIHGSSDGPTSGTGYYLGRQRASSHCHK